MTTIRAHCPTCGDVHLLNTDLTVRVCADNERSAYCFVCPSCGQRVVHDCSSRIADLLISSEVRLQVWRLPAELREAHEGAPLVPDDLIDFHFLLQRHNWFDQIENLVQPS